MTKCLKFKYWYDPLFVIQEVHFHVLSTKSAALTSPPLVLVSLVAWVDKRKVLQSQPKKEHLVRIYSKDSTILINDRYIRSFLQTWRTCIWFKRSKYLYNLISFNLKMVKSLLVYYFISIRFDWNKIYSYSENKLCWNYLKWYLYDNVLYMF